MHLKDYSWIPPIRVHPEKKKDKELEDIRRQNSKLIYVQDSKTSEPYCLSIERREDVRKILIKTLKDAGEKFKIPKPMTQAQLDAYYAESEPEDEELILKKSRVDTLTAYDDMSYSDSSVLVEPAGKKSADERKAAQKRKK